MRVLKSLSFHLSFLLFFCMAARADTPVTLTMQQGSQGVNGHISIAPGWRIYGPKNPLPNTAPVFTWERPLKYMPQWQEEDVWVTDAIESRGYKEKANFLIPIEEKVATYGIHGALSLVACNRICTPITLDIRWPKPSPHSFFYILFISIMAGFLLNFMPCVFPVLSLKLMPLLQKRGAQKRQDIYAFLCGSCTFFVLFSIVTNILRLAGQSAGWGMHFQNPYFLTFFIWLLTLFAARFFGILTFSGLSIMPSQTKNAYLKNFLEGLIISLIATPCTGPFLGTAAGFALSQNMLISTMVFISVWAGFSVPYFVLLLAPNVLKKIMPKPGPWLVKIEKIFGSIMAISCLWFLWVLYIETTLSITISVFLSLLLCIILMQKYKQHRKSIILCSLVICLIPLTDKTWIYDDNYVLEEVAAFKEAAVIDRQTTLVTVTAAWCLTCQANKLLLKQSNIQTLLQDRNVDQVTYDWTRRGQAIGEFIHTYARDGIPFSILFSPKHPNGYVLPEILTIQALKDALM